MAQLPSIELNCPPHSQSMRDLSVQPIVPIPGLSYPLHHPIIWESVTCCRPNPGQETWEQLNGRTIVLCVLGLFSFLVVHSQRSLLDMASQRGKLVQSSSVDIQWRAGRQFLAGPLGILTLARWKHTLLCGFC